MSRAVTIQLLRGTAGCVFLMSLLPFSHGVGLNRRSSLVHSRGWASCVSQTASGFSSPGCNEATSVSLVELRPNFGFSVDGSVSTCWTEQLINLG